MPLLRSLLLALVLTVLAAVPARALPFPADATALLSGAPDLQTPLSTPVAASANGPQALDQAGDRVAFTSESDGLVAGDDDAVSNVYVKDVASGAVTLVSRADGADGKPAHDNCREAAISRDGQAVAFTCDGPLDPVDRNGVSDVYLRTLATGRTTLVSRVNGLNAIGDDRSYGPSIDATGRYVAFVSHARNIAGLPAAADSPGARAYRRRIGVSDGVQPIGVPDGAVLPATQAVNVETVAISGDGTTVAFDTGAALDAADRNNTTDVYMRLPATDRTVLVSRADDLGAVGNGESRNPRVDGDGHTIAFESTATNLGGDQWPDDDVYTRDPYAGETELVSVPAGIETNAAAVVASISSDGGAVAYVTEAVGLDPADSVPDGLDVYVRRDGRSILASRADGPLGAPFDAARGAAISGDGTHVATTVGGQHGTAPGRVELRDLGGARTRLVSRPAGAAPFDNDGGDAGDGAVSADGRFVAFVTTAPALGAVPAGDGAVVVRDTETGGLTLASRADGPAGAPLAGAPRDLRITPDGRYVVFTLDSRGRFLLAPAFTSVWRRDLRDGRTALVSRADGADGAPADSYAGDPSISDDGSRVAFLTSATNFGDGDATGDEDVHVRDLASGRTLLASRRAGVDPPGAVSGDAFSGEISGDGRSVAFSSYENGIAEGAYNGAQNVFVRRLDTGATVLASRADDDRASTYGGSVLALDRDGDRVVFSSGDPQLPAGRDAIYVRDLTTSRLLLVSRADGPDGAPADNRIGEARISADGERVAFEASSSGPLAPGAPTDEGRRVYLRGLASARTRLLSRASGPEGAVPAFARLTGIAAGGGCVAFSGDPHALGAGTSDDYVQQFVRLVDARCGAAADDDVPGGDEDDGGGPGGRVPASRDRTAPRLTSVRLSSTRLRRGGKATALAAARRARRAPRAATSSVLSFRSSERGRLTIAVTREVAGRRAARGRCVQAGERVRRGRRCIALKPVATLRRTLRRAGANRLTLTAKFGRRTLAPGSHRLTLVVRDAAGNSSKPATVKLTVVR
ncbi:hypothetical protein Q5424_25855 [Conexibacter sp. JD483]|uniref:hypothetical protein n=1 Tax=unclassified Conexibacter TaxID=2627773 RepID=UPI0027207D4F|nr:MULTISPECIES: hypothetical protein [unclassified Conexibacter]MDO8186535.1 hypothetical protein [Conexibacter sp. CPCC 205706]MDO8200104.1 hypothetical protein [Conexibacter sp. CPCC 205762]MDR9372550.1 hypothetical protein [Conexibacter sp. JD483]